MQSFVLILPSFTIFRRCGESFRVRFRGIVSIFGFRGIVNNAGVHAGIVEKFEFSALDVLQ